MIKRFATLGAISFVLLIGGCGNSGGGNNEPPVPGGAQGFFSGTTSSGLTFLAIVLPDDKFFAAYGKPNGSYLQVTGTMGGNGTSFSTTYTSNLVDTANVGGGNVQTNSGSLTATYVAASSISGTINESGTQTTFTGTAVSNAVLNWNTAASINDVAGTIWIGYLVEGEFTSVTFGGNTFSGGSNGGCMFTGTVNPDTSGKNFFHISVKFGAAPCDLPNQTAMGVAVVYTDGTTRRLLAMGGVGTIGRDAFAGVP